MKKVLQLSVAIILWGALTGCIETKKEVTLNPDGSGKVIYKSIQPVDGNIGFNMGAEQKEESPDEKAKKEVQSMLENSEGVDAWENVSYKINDIGKLEFEGTAYFKSFDKLKLGGSLKSGKDVELTTSKGKMKLAFISDKKKKNALKKPASTKKLTGAALDKQVKIEQAKLQQMLGMMGAVLGSFKDTMIYHFPGKISTVRGFKKVDDKSIELVLDGEKIIKAMKEFAADKKAIRAAISSGKDLKEGPPENYMNKKIFGSSELPEVVVSGKMKPAFDYDKSVAKAKKAFPAMCKKLGLEIKK